MLKETLANENKRRKAANYRTTEEQRHNERGTVERVNEHLKDEFGARSTGTRSCQGDVPFDVWHPDDSEQCDGKALGQCCLKLCGAGSLHG